MSKFKIIIEPTQRGLRVRTDSLVGDTLADELAQYLEEALVQFANAEQRRE